MRAPKRRKPFSPDAPAAILTVMTARRALWTVPALIFAVASSASAHGLLLRSFPAAGENVAVAPREIKLVFSERPERVFTRITLFAEHGAVVALDTIVLGPGNTASARIAGALHAGLYTVSWRSAGRDGHPVGGEFTFSIASDAVGVVQSAAGDEEPAAPARGVAAPAATETTPVFAPFATLLRWVTLVALIAAVGAVCFRLVVISRIEREMDVEIATEYLPGITRGAARLGFAAACTLLVAAFLRLLTQSAALDGSDPNFIGHAIAMITGSVWGKAWLLQVLSAAMAAGAFAAVKGPRHRAWIVAAGASVAAVLSVALSGHAVVVPEFVAATVAAHVVHAVAAAGWLGTLLAIAVVGLPRAFRLDRDDRWTVVADIVHAFSPTALAFAAVTALAGVFMSWTHLPDLPSLWASEYGRLLLLKLFFVAGTAATGAYNWLRVRPALGARAGARRLRRSAAAELGIAALVLAVTAVLVATPMPAS
jgi:copper transport protein